jgi:type I restriction enzyme S subunit
MAEVAPLHRRPVVVDLASEYPQVSARSFGRGTFHKPPLKGSEITWQKPFLVKQGDILISNIKAWEGAIAVATLEDNDRYGSHRYLTCLPMPGVATARFVCFHLLTPQGLHDIGEASPGSADRNRTLSTTALSRISIPVPAYAQQLWFDSLCMEIGSLKRLQAETSKEMDAFMPSVLSRAFAGEI